MTVNALGVFQGPYYPNGITTHFPFDEFEVVDEGEVSATLNGAAVDASSFTVSLNDDGTGEAIFFTPPAGDGATDELYLILNPDFRQQTTLANQGPYYQTTLEKIVDRLASRAIWLRDKASRSLHVPRGEVAPEVGSLAAADGKALGIVDGKIVPIANNVAGAEQVRADVEAVAAAVDIVAAAAATARGGAEDARDAAIAAKDDAETAQDLAEAAQAAAEAVTQAASDALAAGTVSDLVGTRIYASRAALNADLVPADNLYALVVGDPTPANNDLYQKNGATTTGSWDGPLGFFAAASALAQAWAEGTEPGGSGSKSSKDWATGFSRSIGRRNGWPDPFFRRLAPPENVFLGRDRWYGNNSAGEAFGGWTRVKGSLFDGNVLRRAGGYNNTSFSGPMLYLDEIDAAPGDTITAYLLIVGSGDTVYGSHRWLNAAGVELSNGLMANAAGNTNGVVSAATPKWLRVSATVPANGASIALWPYCLSGAAGFDVVACWAFKGGTSEGPDWPSVDDSFNDIRNAEGRLDTLELNAPPYIGWQSVLGDAEMVGDASYATKVIGLYEQMTAKTVFNLIQARVWASTGAAVEWKLFIRDTASAFNPSVETAAASGTIGAGNFPLTDSLYSLALSSKVTAAASKYVFIFFRAVDNSNINVKRWLYNAGVVPARHAFAIGTSNGWNQTWAATGPGSGFGQVALKLLAQGDEGRELTDRVTALEEAVESIVPAVPPYFTIPAIVYAVVGTELNLYHDAIFSGRSDGLPGLVYHSVSVIGPKGQDKSRCFRFTPVSGDVGTHAFVATARDAAGNIVATRSFSITVVAATAKGSAKNVLMIGDSLTGPGVITSTAQAKFAALGATVPTFVGSQGSSPAKHEGRGGKTFSFFATAGGTAYRFPVTGVGSVGVGATYTVSGVTYTVVEVNISGGTGSIQATGASAPPTNGTLAKASGTGDASIPYTGSTTESGNPLWNGGALNVATYRSNQGIGSVIDLVTIQLGVNDAYGNAAPSACVTYAKAIVDAFLADNAACKIVIELPTLCGNTDDGFAANYGASNPNRDIYEARLFAIRSALIAAFDAGAYHANARIGSAGLQVDRYYGYARSSVASASRISTMVDEHVNGVHPDTPGYNQNGDAIFAEAMALI